MALYTEDTICKTLNPTPLYVTKNIRVETGVSHSHDYVELTFIFEGRGEYEINGQIYSVKEKDLLFINPKDTHTTRITGENLGIYSIAFTDIAFQNMTENCFFFENQGPVYSCDDPLSKKITTIISTMLEENKANLPGKYFVMQSHLMQLLILIYRAISYTENPAPKSLPTGKLLPSSGKEQIVAEIKAYLEEHYTEKISLDVIGQNMYLSPIYISKIFKEETEVSPIHYLIDLRLGKAARLLTQTGLKIQEIAVMTGYENVYHFSRLFKNHFHASPKAYREAHGNYKK